MRLVGELARRKVLKAGAAYLATACRSGPGPSRWPGRATWTAPWKRSGRELVAGWVRERYLLETMAGTPDPLVAPLRAQPEVMRLMAQVRARNTAAFAALGASDRPLLPDAAEPPLAGR